MRGAIALACASIALVARTSPAAAQQEPTVEWSDRWPRAHWVEYVDVAALITGSFLINASPTPNHAKWSGPILFDSWARSAFRASDASTRDNAAAWSDQLYHVGVIAPLVIDNAVVALGVHRNGDVALQMTVIDLQSIGISGILSLGAEHTVGRARPPTQPCGPGSEGAGNAAPTPCNAEDLKSFFSGHTAATFTVAGLTCVHHQHLPLYGGGLPDLFACLTMVTLASTTGVLRMVADRHWASDVMIGASIGVINGYILPSWLHYGFGSSRRHVDTMVRTSFGYVAPVPQVYAGGAGLGFVGAF